MHQLTPHERSVAETAFLIKESLQALERFTQDPSLASLESVIATCDQTSSLCKRLEAMDALREDAAGLGAQAAPLPMQTITLVGEIAAGTRSHCRECGGWKKL